MKTSGFFTLIAIVLTMNMNAETLNQNNHAQAYNYRNTFLTYLSTTEETPVEIAEWMLDVEAFETKPEMLTVEDWMLDVNAFNEPDNKIESWMFDETLFKATDETIEIEDWMLDVENFMCKDNYAKKQNRILDLATYN